MIELTGLQLAAVIYGSMIIGAVTMFFAIALVSANGRNPDECQPPTQAGKEGTK